MISDKAFKNQDFTKTRLQKAEYENCVFEGCDFSDSFLDNQHFLECEFNECNLSNANIAHTTFNEVVFLGCKMIGLKFETLNDFLLTFSFEHCALNLCSFYQMELRNQRFKHCKLIEADFTEASLTGAVFADCDLNKAIFQQTNLEKVDFTTAANFDVDPEINLIKKAKFAQDGLYGLLRKHHIIVK